MDDNQENQDTGRVLKFPTPAQRKIQDSQSRKTQVQNALRMAAQARGQASKQPFFKFGNIPPFTRALVAAFLCIHVIVFLILRADMREIVFYSFGFTPASYTSGAPLTITSFFAPLTYAFLHGSAMHLIFNTVMTLSLGMFFEKIMGTRMAALFFILCTLTGALTYFAFSPFSPVPMIGASGGLSGIFGAVLLLMFQQNTRLHNIGGRFARFGPWPMIVFWGLMMSVPGLLMGQPVAWQAHLGGYVTGLILILLIQKRALRP